MQAWAAQQFQRRYNQAPPQPGEIGFPLLVFNKLNAEFTMLRSWFQSDGRLSMLLVSQSTVKLRNPVLGSGISVDFKVDLSINQHVIEFKGHLVALSRMLALHTSKSPARLAPLTAMVCSAYRARAEGHDWKNIPGRYSGEDLALRWAAHKSYAFMLGVGADADWAWAACGCLAAFGPADYIRQVDSAG